MASFPVNPLKGWSPGLPCIPMTSEKGLLNFTCSLEDVHLDKAKHQQLQKALAEKNGDMTLAYDSSDQSLRVGQGVLHLLKKGKAKISHWETKRYTVSSTEMDQVVIWRDEKEECRKGYRIPLCMVSMKKEWSGGLNPLN